MTAKLSIILTAIVLTATTTFAQTPDDNIAFLKVQNQINDGNYYKALETLSTISNSGKSSSFYLSYSATCYENTYQFDQASSYYKELYTKTNSFDAMKKVAEMDEYQENKQKVLQVDSVIKVKFSSVGIYKYRFTNDAVEKLVIIGKVAEGSFIIGIWSLPAFRNNTLVACDGKLTTNETNNKEEYIFFGKYQTLFRGEYVACNKDLPPSTFFGTLDPFFNKMTLLIFGYDCIKNADGTYSTVKHSESNPKLWILDKVSGFNLK